MTETSSQILFYTPSALINIISNAVNIGEAKKMIPLKGMYLPGKGQSYNDSYYDTLRDETSDFQLTLVVPGLLRVQLQAEKIIEFNGFLSKRTNNKGGIEFQVNMIQLYSQEQSKFSEEDVKALEIQQQKSSVGYRDVESYLKSKIIRDEKIHIVVIVGKGNIIHDDIKSQMRETISYYDLVFHPVNLNSQAEIEKALIIYNNAGVDIIVVSRGGGDNLEIFNRHGLAQRALELKPFFLTAIGHKQDNTLLQKMADKAFITPTAFGQFLHELYNNTHAELEHSKAKLIEDITLQLKVTYDGQVKNLNQQLADLKEMGQRSQAEIQQNNVQRLNNLNAQLEESKAINLREKESLQMQLAQQQRLTADATSLAAQIRQQAESSTLNRPVPTGKILIILVIALIAGILIGYLLR